MAEAKIAERDQRIIEVDRLLDCMGKVRTGFLCSVSVVVETRNDEFLRFLLHQSFTQHT